MAEQRENKQALDRATSMRGAKASLQTTVPPKKSKSARGMKFWRFTADAADEDDLTIVWTNPLHKSDGVAQRRGSLPPEPQLQITKDISRLSDNLQKLRQLQLNADEKFFQTKKQEEFLDNIVESELKFELDDYGRLTSIGEGATCVVRKALYRDQVVAVKEFPDDEGKEFVKHEVRILARIQHENVVKLIGSINTKLVMELAENYSLLQAVSKKKVTWYDNGLSIAIGVAEGLKFIHSLRVFHLDLKSANVLLDAKMTPKITDVGLAREAGRRENHVTTCKAKFTANWAPPESFPKDFITLSSKSDIYSFGMIIYEIYTGNVPWGIMAPEKIEELVLKGKRPEEKPAFPRSLKVLVHKMWDQRPSYRPTANDVLRDLNHMLHNPYSSL